MTSFLDSIESLSGSMCKTASHIAGCLKATELNHPAYGVLHRMERTLFDCATHLKHLLAELPPELRATLENI
jgi:hypothetical protein